LTGTHKLLPLIASLVVILLLSSLLSNKYYHYHYVTPTIIAISTAFAKPHTVAPPTLTGPIILNDPHLKIETVFKGLDAPTSMAFVGPDDILVLEKDEGTVQRIIDGKMVSDPLLEVPVATKVDRGMLGIAISKHEDGPTYVFLYYTESGGKTGDDRAGIQPMGNRIYRYELDYDHDKLINPKLLVTLPAIPRKPLSPETNDNGGTVRVGPDSDVYFVIGQVGSHQGQAQNVNRGPGLDGTGGILRVTQDGQPVPNPPLGNNSYPSNLYYAYGIRNSFGLDFDPITGNLWDTENGPDFGDEINLVIPGFNSGWEQVQGIWTREHLDAMGPVAPLQSNSLVNFGGRGIYHVPQFTWNKTIGPTAIKFFNSDKLGKQYENDIFVSDIDNGNIYHFKLNQQRDGLLLSGSLADTVAYTPKDSQQAVFATGFGGITDLEVGPGDGYLYVLSYTGGAIYRIVPSISEDSDSK
jgi:aldose sugar dehydrogenase